MKPPGSNSLQLYYAYPTILPTILQRNSQTVTQPSFLDRHHAGTIYPIMIHPRSLPDPTPLPRYHSIMLSHYHPTTLPPYHPTTLQHYHPTTLPHQHANNLLHNHLPSDVDYLRRVHITTFKNHSHSVPILVVLSANFQK